MDHVSIIGIDISKRSFQLHGATAAGVPVLRRKLSRGKILECLASQTPCLVVMETCGGAPRRQLLAIEPVALDDIAHPVPRPEALAHDLRFLLGAPARAVAGARRIRRGPNPPARRATRSANHNRLHHFVQNPASADPPRGEGHRTLLYMYREGGGAIAYAWCVFGSKLGRILQQQGRRQLGIGWSGCRGFTVSEATIHSAQLGLTGTLGDWLTGHGVMLFDPEQSFGRGTNTDLERNQLQMRRAYVLFGDLDRSPFYASLGKMAVPVGLTDTVNPFRRWSGRGSVGTPGSDCPGQQHEHQTPPNGPQQELLRGTVPRPGGANGRPVRALPVRGAPGAAPAHCAVRPLTPVAPVSAFGAGIHKVKLAHYPASAFQAELLRRAGPGRAGRCAAPCARSAGTATGPATDSSWRYRDGHRAACVADASDTGRKPARAP